MVFLLHDTHGFPWDLTQLIARERGFDVDLDRYEELMSAQRERGSFGGSGEKAPEELWRTLRGRIGETEFLGYDGDGHEGEGTLRALVKDGREVPSSAPARRASWSPTALPSTARPEARSGTPGASSEAPARPWPRWSIAGQRAGSWCTR